MSIYLEAYRSVIFLTDYEDRAYTANCWIWRNMAMQAVENMSKRNRRKLQHAGEDRNPRLFQDTRNGNTENYQITAKENSVYQKLSVRKMRWPTKQGLWKSPRYEQWIQLLCTGDRIGYGTRWGTLYQQAVFKVDYSESSTETGNDRRTRGRQPWIKRCESFIWFRYRNEEGSRSCGSLSATCVPQRNKGREEEP